MKATRIEAYAAITQDVETVQAFLKAAGLPETSIRASAVDLLELSHEDLIEEGAKTRHETVFDGWRAQPGELHRAPPTPETPPCRARPARALAHRDHDELTRAAKR